MSSVLHPAIVCGRLAVLAGFRPLQPAPELITDGAAIVDLNVRRRDRLGGILHEYEHAA